MYINKFVEIEMHFHVIWGLKTHTHTLIEKQKRNTEI